MNCAICHKKATHLLYNDQEPHCMEHMLEALCSVPVSVIDLESYKHKEVVNYAKEA